MFEISVINKQNKGLVMDCMVKAGDIVFNRVFLVNENADEFVGMHWFDKSKKKTDNEFYGKFYGPNFMFLSENVQNSMIEYLYSIGLRPEIGMCVEYLSWNKE
jgi:hypothetical protein